MRSGPQWAYTIYYDLTTKSSPSSLLKAQVDNLPVIGGDVLLVPFFWQQVNGRLQKLITVEGKERGGWKKAFRTFEIRE